MQLDAEKPLSSLSSLSFFSPRKPFAFPFTLLELLVVLSILLILGALLLPVLSKGRQVARSCSCLSIMREYAFATCLYADDFADCYPDIRTYLLQESGFSSYIASSLPLRCPGDGETLRRNRLGLCNNQLISIGGTSNLSDSAGNVTGGKGAFLQKRTSAVNAFPSRRCQWTDYQDTNSGNSISGAALSIGKGAGNWTDTLREYVFRHPNGTANGAFADGHAAPIRCLAPLEPTGHDLLPGAKWLFPGNMTYPYGPRQLGGPGTTATITNATDSPSVQYR